MNAWGSAGLLALALLVTPGRAGPADPPGDSPEVKKLLVARRDVLRKALEARRTEFNAGRGTLDSLQEIAKALLQAELDLATRPAERVAAHAAYFKVCSDLDELTAVRYQAGRCSLPEHLLARAERLNAEIGLRRAGGTPPKGTKPPREQKPFAPDR